MTGTNGKTTVTTLIAEMLAAGGRRALAAGNIGRPLLDAVHDDVDVVVAEVSSFQLRFTETFRPRVAVFLNVAEDHLDWHPSFKDYVAAKARIFANQAGDDLLVFNADDEAVARGGGRGSGPLRGLHARPRAETPPNLWEKRSGSGAEGSGAWTGTASSGPTAPRSSPPATSPRARAPRHRQRPGGGGRGRRSRRDRRRSDAEYWPRFRGSPTE